MYLVDIRELRARIAQIEKDLQKNLSVSQYKWLVCEKKLWKGKLLEEIKKQGYGF